MQAFILRFTMLGPAIGSFAFVATNMLTQAYGGIGAINAPISIWEFPIWEFILGFSLLGLYGLIVAFPLGFIPAFICGFLYWLTLQKFATRSFNRTHRILIAAFIGASFTALFGTLFFLNPIKQKLGATIVTWAITGAISAGCCALSIGKNTYINAFPKNTSN